MTQVLRQSTAVDVLIGPFLDLTDGATAETGESPSVKLSKNGQALAAKSDVTTPVHDADGYYNCEFDATDTNTVGTLILTVAKSATALPVRHEFMVIEEAAYDAIYASGAAPKTGITVSSIDANVITATAINAGAITSAKFAAGAIDAAAIAADAIGSSEFAQAAADKVWSSVTRVLTAGTNIALAKGVGVTGFNDLSAAQVNAEVDTALADYDPPTHAELTSATSNLDATVSSRASAANLSTVAGYLDTEIAAILAVIDKLDTAMEADGPVYRFTTNALEQAPTGGSAPSAADIADAVHDEAVDGSLTLRQSIRLLNSSAFGKLSGAETTTVVIRDAADSKDRITATVTADGNRTAVTVDAT